MEILFRAALDEYFGCGYVDFESAQREAEEIGGKVIAFLTWC